jgi:hypothetical protein
MRRIGGEPWSLAESRPAGVVIQAPELRCLAALGKARLLVSKHLPWI